MVAIGLIAATRGRWRWLWLLHPVLTMLVVVSTGNHFWFDGLFAAALLGVALLFLRGSFPSRRSIAGLPSGAATGDPVGRPAGRRDVIVGVEAEAAG